MGVWTTGRLSMKDHAYEFPAPRSAWDEPGEPARSPLLISRMNYRRWAVSGSRPSTRDLRILLQALADHDPDFYSTIQGAVLGVVVAGYRMCLSIARR